VLLVEDLGEATLAEYLTQHQDCTRALYHLAIRDLARAQLALRHLPDRCLVQQRAFDASLLRWEVDHFRDWALDARGIRLSPGQGEAFDQAAGALSKQIGELPRGFVHRDYQSRNLMVRETPDG